MRKHVLIFISIIFSVIIIQCSDETENKQKDKQQNKDIDAVVTGSAVEEFDSTDLNTTNIEVMDENKTFSLAYNFKKGDSFSYRLTSLSYSKQSLKADTSISNIVEQKIIRVIKFRTISLENDSVAEIECNVSSIKVWTDANGEKIAYQSGSKLDSAEAKNFIEYEGMVNNPFHFKITKYGKLLDVLNTDNVTDRYIILTGIKGSIGKREEVIFKNEIVNNILEPLLLQVFKELPSQQLKVKSTWDKVMDPTPILVFELQLINHYRVSELEMLKNDRIVLINGTATFTVKGDFKHTKNGINYVFQKPVSEASGKIFFNLDKGLIQKSKSKTLLNLSYSMEKPSPKGVANGVSNELTTNDEILELL